MQRTAGAVVVISSHVARGFVGNRVLVFALERLGFTVWAVPTIVLPFHLGHGEARRIVAEEAHFSELLEVLARDARVRGVAAVISGVLASSEQAEAVAGFVSAVKAARPYALYLCDPVIGDEGELYVGEALAAKIRDRLLPLADAATPNAFECAWLAGRRVGAPDDLAALARELPPPVVVVTSTPGLMRGHLGNLLVDAGGATMIEHPAVATPAKGTGDLVAALLVARRLQGFDWTRAAEMAVAATFEVIAGTAKAGADELLLPELQDAIVEPRASVSLRRLVTAGRPAPF
jgi:pyridoxine kinase